MLLTGWARSLCRTEGADLRLCLSLLSWNKRCRVSWCSFMKGCWRGERWGLATPSMLMGQFVTIWMDHPDTTTDLPGFCCSLREVLTGVLPNPIFVCIQLILPSNAYIEIGQCDDTLPSPQFIPWAFSQNLRICYFVQSSVIVQLSQWH